MVIRMGGFNIAMNYLAVLGKNYQMSGIEDLLIGSGMYGSSTTLTLLKGKAYKSPQDSHGSRVSYALACLRAVAL